MVDNESHGYILRISQDKWEEQVYRLSKYYSGIIRKWTVGTPILFVKKTNLGDSFIGYGIADKIEMPWELSPEEEKYIKDHGWRCAISFEPIVKFSNPLPIKDTFLANDKRKGKLLHGIIIKQNHINEVINAVE